MQAIIRRPALLIDKFPPWFRAPARVPNTFSVALWCPRVAALIGNAAWHLIDSTNHQLQRCPDAHPICDACHDEEGEEATCPINRRFAFADRRAWSAISPRFWLSDLSDADADLHARVTRWLTEKNVQQQQQSSDQHSDRQWPHQDRRHRVDLRAPRAGDWRARACEMFVHRTTHSR